MARYDFRVGTAYAGRVLRVRERPIENVPSEPISLLRVEFEIYLVINLRASGFLFINNQQTSQRYCDGSAGMCEAPRVI